MSRIIRTDSPARTRQRLMKALASAFHILRQEKTTEAMKKDIFAFILLTLEALFASVDQTASAWEKRDYWIKADRLRDKWKWVSETHEQLLVALNENDLDEALHQVTSLNEYIEPIPIPRKQSGYDLWKGAWSIWQKRQQ